MDIVDLSQDDITTSSNDNDDVVVVSEINTTPKGKTWFITNKRKESPEANKENQNNLTSNDKIKLHYLISSEFKKDQTSRSRE